MTTQLPFAAVVGQEAAKQALLLAAVEPRLGGVLLRGDKGSAKTTLARGLAALLVGDAPFVELPLGAGEDRVLGALDVTALLTEGTPRFRPGLLAAAHGGVLYVDEINLLADHLVDALLDVATSGVNRVERDGLSHTHPARFVLIASMNPEEGELRPQLLDRFGLSVEVRAPASVSDRVEAVRRQLHLDAAGHHRFREETDRIHDRLVAACAHHAQVAVDDAVLLLASAVALEVGAEGLRADLMLVRAARARAALEAREAATEDDVRAVAEFVLGHRRRSRPFEQPGISDEQLDEAFADARDSLDQPPQPSPTSDDAEGGPAPESPPPHPDASPGPASGNRTEPPDDHVDAATSPASAPEDRLDEPALETVTPTALPIGSRPRPRASGSSPAGSGQVAAAARGRALRATDPGPDRPADGPASALSLATRRAVTGDRHAAPTPGDLRAVDRQATTGSLVVFVVDASGSMGVQHRMAATKAAVIGMLGDAYRRRARIALITFRADEAEVVLRPTASVEIARARLAEIRTGGTSPIAAGLAAAQQLLDGARRQQDVAPTVVLVTDGRATGAGPGAGDPLEAPAAALAGLVRRGAQVVVVDSETGWPRLGLAGRLAEEAGAPLLRLDDLANLAELADVADLAGLAGPTDLGGRADAAGVTGQPT